MKGLFFCVARSDFIVLQCGIVLFGLLQNEKEFMRACFVRDCVILIIFDCKTTVHSEVYCLHSTMKYTYSENGPFCISEAYRKKIFFNYEKRIRMRSPPEKV